MIYCDNAATVCNTGAEIKKKKRVLCVLILVISKSMFVAFFPVLGPQFKY